MCIRDSFYCALGGYCLKYVVLNIGNLTGAAFGSNGLSGSEVFGSFLTSQGEGVIYGLIFVVLTMVIVMGGVAGGIEKFCGIGMPALFFMLLICIVRACTPVSYTHLDVYKRQPSRRSTACSAA